MNSIGVLSFSTCFWIVGGTISSNAIVNPQQRLIGASLSDPTLARVFIGSSFYEYINDKK